MSGLLDFIGLGTSNSSSQYSPNNNSILSMNPSNSSTDLSNLSPYLLNVGGQTPLANTGTVTNWTPPGTSEDSNFLGLDKTDLQGIGTGFYGLSALGNLYDAFQANNLANKQFNYTKSVTDTNLNNQIKSYNTALNDKINSRASVEGLTPQQVSSYLAANSLSRSS